MTESVVDAPADVPFWMMDALLNPATTKGGIPEGDGVPVAAGAISMSVPEADARNAGALRAEYWFVTLKWNSSVA